MTCDERKYCVCVPFVSTVTADTVGGSANVCDVDADGLPLLLAVAGTTFGFSELSNALLPRTSACIKIAKKGMHCISVSF